MMMTVDEKLHAYAKNQKDRNIDEKKLQQTIIKSKEAYWDGEIERNMSWLEFFISASFVYTEALVVCSRGSITNPLDDNVLIRQ